MFDLPSDTDGAVDAIDHDYWNFDALDRQLANHICWRSPFPHDQALWMAIALASQANESGNTCLQLTHYASKILGNVPFPELDDWIQRLQRCPLISDGSVATPLVLEKNRLYLYRYWMAEKQLAQHFEQRAEQTQTQTLNVQQLAQDCAVLYPPTASGGYNWQKIAVGLACYKRLLLLTGGPGTGKTTTVARILQLMQRQRPELRVALAAPTGKAAFRMGESLQAARKELQQLLPTAPNPMIVGTLHSLLHPLHRGGFLHHAKNPLPLEMLIIDEASMIDLEMMLHVCEALPLSASLIILGDPKQLASISAGSVLSDLASFAVNGFCPETTDYLLRVTQQDLTQISRPLAPIQDCQVTLVETHRFKNDGEILPLAQAIQQGDANAFLERVTWHDFIPEHFELLAATIQQGYKPYLEQMRRLRNQPVAQLQACLPELVKALSQAFSRFRILCAYRNSPLGSIAMNHAVEELLRREKLMPYNSDADYAGKVIQVTRNQPDLGLFNGDVGFLLPDPHCRFLSWFADGGGFRSILPARIYAYEKAWAITIHKSQGSEFDQAMILLGTRPSHFLSRELLYTAITRAKQNVTLWGEEEAIRQAIRHKTKRQSGFAERFCL